MYIVKKIQILKILYSTFVEFNLEYLGYSPRTSNHKFNKIYIFEFWRNQESPYEFWDDFICWSIALQYLNL